MKIFKLKTWWPIASLIQILFFEYLSMLFLAGLLGTFIERQFHIFGCVLPSEITKGDLLLYALGAACLFWALREIFVPRVKHDVFRPTMKLGGFIAPNPIAGSQKYDFLSTHPSYAALEGLLVVSVLIILIPLSNTHPQIDGCGGLGGIIFTSSMLAIALLYLIARLISWYVLKRRFPPNINVKDLEPTQSVLSLVIVVTVPIMLITVLISVQSLLKKSPILPVVDNQSIANGFTQHPELNEQYVRITGELTNPVSAKCGCEKNPHGDCLWTGASIVTLNDHQEVLAVSIRDMSQLYQITDNKSAGDSVQFVGKIETLPDPKEKSWKYDDCADTLYPSTPNKERLYLKIEDPSNSQ